MDNIPPSTDLTKIGIIPHPLGLPPNLLDPPNHSSWPLKVGVTLSVISGMFVTIRFITNLKYARGVEIDDYLCLFAQITMVGYVAMSCLMSDFMKHGYDIPLSSITEAYAQENYAINMIISPAYWASKSAILALYIRVFSIKKWVKYLSYLAILILFGFHWALIPLASAYCVPRNGHSWVSALEKCGAQVKVIGPMHGGLGVAADIFMLVLPLPVLNKLQLSKPKRMGLMVVFMSGFFALAASCVGVYFRVQIYTTADQTWQVASVHISTFVECYVAIMCSCAPAVYSCWLNYVSKSAVYGSIISKLTSRSTIFGGSGSFSDYFKKASQQPRPSESGYSNMDGSLLARDEFLSRGPDVYNVQLQDIGQNSQAILKSTTIKQQSNVHRR